MLYAVILNQTDPLAALIIVPLVVKEGLEGFRGECHDSD
jgi:hypothetical protein